MNNIPEHIKEHAAIVRANAAEGALFLKKDGSFPLAAAGRLVVIATQVEREGSALASYAVGRRLLGCENVIEARCMTLEAAYAKLSAALAGGRGGKAAEQFFRTPVEYDIF